MSVTRGTVKLRRSSLGLWLKDCPSYEDARRDDRSHSGLAWSLGEVARILRRHGWYVRVDTSVSKLIRFRYRIGANPKSRLEVEYQLGGRNLSVKFFQNVQNVDNPNGGRYDFDAYDRMTYLQRKEAELLLMKIAQTLGSLNECEIEGPPARIEDGFEAWWAKRKGLSFHTDDKLGRARYTNGDRSRKGSDGKLLEHGGSGWALHRTYGRWFRGKLYYDLNDMWIIKSGGAVLFCSCWEIRSTLPEQCRGRQVPTASALRSVRRLLASAVSDERFLDAHRYSQVAEALEIK